MIRSPPKSKPIIAGHISPLKIIQQNLSTKLFCPHRQTQTGKNNIVGRSNKC